MKSVLLIGLGRFGLNIAKKLNELKHEVMAVDINDNRVTAALPYVTKAVIGDSTKKEFLLSLGIRNYDLCIVTIGESFQNSLETTALLKELGAQKVVARASRDVHAEFLKRNGADEVVYPEGQLASWTAIRYTADNIFDYIELDGNYAIFEVSVPKIWTGKAVGEINIRKKYAINILAVRKNGKLFPDITTETMLCENDILLVLGSYTSMRKCFRI
ncbi:MAG: TrkA family potassium uptake protein [Oscillospiraceae bacterium]|nr:TrkA family potassium uptake protein [Oscillospiraceae bacterium]